MPKLMQFVIADVFVMLSDRSERPVFENVSISCFAASGSLWKIKEFLQECSDFR